MQNWFDAEKIKPEVVSRKHSDVVIVWVGENGYSSREVTTAYYDFYNNEWEYIEYKYSDYPVKKWMYFPPAPEGETEMCNEEQTTEPLYEIGQLPEIGSRVTGYHLYHNCWFVGTYERNKNETYGRLVLDKEVNKLNWLYWSNLAYWKYAEQE